MWHFTYMNFHILFTFSRQFTYLPVLTAPHHKGGPPLKASEPLKGMPLHVMCRMNGARLVFTEQKWAKTYTIWPGLCSAIDRKWFMSRVGIIAGFRNHSICITRYSLPEPAQQGFQLSISYRFTWHNWANKTAKYTDNNVVRIFMNFQFMQIPIVSMSQ